MRARGRAAWRKLLATPRAGSRFRRFAAGTLWLHLVFDPTTGTGLRTEPYHGIVLPAGKTTQLTIPLRPTFRIRGSFREKGSSRPIAGVLVALNGMFGGDDFAVTDAGGNFQGFITRENFQPYGWPVRTPWSVLPPAS